MSSLYDFEDGDVEIGEDDSGDGRYVNLVVQRLDEKTGKRERLGISLAPAEALKLSRALERWGNHLFAEEAEVQEKCTR